MSGSGDLDCRMNPSRMHGRVENTSQSRPATFCDTKDLWSSWYVGKLRMGRMEPGKRKDSVRLTEMHDKDDISSQPNIE